MVFLRFLIQHLELTLGLALVMFGFWRISVTNKKQKLAEKMLKKAIDTKVNEPLSLHPEIDPNKCAGCGSCTKVCPEGDIISLINHKAVLVGPSKCVGHGECELACPMNAIRLVFGTKTRGVDIPRLTSNYETNVPGLYIAGELGGMGLIRNAIKQGAIAGKHAATTNQNISGTDYDLVIVGAGPAGMSAALAAIAAKKKYLLIDQNTLGGTVYNFPRQKVVMSHPAEIPGIGTMKFNRNQISKEELLEYWNQVRIKTGLKIKEKTKFEGIEKLGNTFFVKTNKGSFSASKVILAMGLRGTPRQLGIPNEDQPKVTYNLLEPDQYIQKEICVVGGGNAGVEAAQRLGDPKLKNNVRLLIRGPQFDRCNEENQTKITKMAEIGHVEICFETSVSQIGTKDLVIETKGIRKTIPNDYLFIFAGAELPHKFLMSLGVEIEKKFGEGIKKTA